MARPIKVIGVRCVGFIVVSRTFCWVRDICGPIQVGTKFEIGRLVALCREGNE